MVERKKSRIAAGCDSNYQISSRRNDSPRKDSYIIEATNQLKVNSMDEIKLYVVYIRATQSYNSVLYICANNEDIVSN